MRSLVGYVVACMMAGTVAAQDRVAPATAEGQVLEIRSYVLKPGTREDFHGRFVRDVLPLLQRWQIDVVAYGPSLHDRQSYFLMRGFTSLLDRERSEEAFYASDDWRAGPRAAVLAAIERYTTTVIRVDHHTLADLRRLMQTQAAAADRK